MLLNSLTQSSIILILLFAGMIEAAGFYQAAGILPYSYDEQSGKIKILVGVSSVHRNQASDFGGLKDETDNNNPQATAAREACEELIFIFDSCERFKSVFAARKKYGKSFDISRAHSSCYKLFLKLTESKRCPCSFSNNYKMYFVPIGDLDSLEKRFADRRLQYNTTLPRCWNETVEITWLDLDVIYAQIDKRNDKASINVNGYTLYEPFVQSLLTARSNGIIKQISEQVKS